MEKPRSGLTTNHSNQAVNVDETVAKNPEFEVANETGKA